MLSVAAGGIIGKERRGHSSETSKNSTVIVSDVKVCKIWRTACLPVVYSEYNIGRASIPDNRNC